MAENESVKKRIGSLTANDSLLFNVDLSQIKASINENKTNIKKLNDSISINNNSINDLRISIKTNYDNIVNLKNLVNDIVVTKLSTITELLENVANEIGDL